MPWQPMHMSAFFFPAAASPGLASWALAAAAAMPNDRATAMFASFIIICAECGMGRACKTANYRGALILNRSPQSTLDEVPRLSDLRRHARPDARRQRGGDAEAPAPRQGRARHRQDDARRGSRAGARHAAPAVAHQVDDEGTAGPLRV